MEDPLVVLNPRNIKIYLLNSKNLGFNLNIFKCRIPCSWKAGLLDDPFNAVQDEGNHKRYIRWY
jgi:hypothetical protein